MEKINKTVNQNMKELKKKYNNSRYVRKCENCEKEFEYNGYKAFLSGKISNLCNECQQKQLKKERIEEEIMNIPPLYRDIDTDKKILLKKLYNMSVFISGGIGVGKTVLMASLIKKYIREDKRIKWISYPEFIMDLQSLFRKDSEETPFDVAHNVASFHGILAIDDIGAEKLTDYVRQITYYIINYREQYKLITLITSNFSLADIDKLIDSRISSRIVGMCKCVKLKGKDRRVKK